LNPERAMVRAHGTELDSTGRRRCDPVISALSCEDVAEDGDTCLDGTLAGIAESEHQLGWVEGVVDSVGAHAGLGELRKPGVPERRTGRPVLRGSRRTVKGKVGTLVSDVGLRPVWVGGPEHVETVDGMTRLWFAVARRQRGRHTAFRTLTDLPRQRVLPQRPRPLS
jgi:hypothetical protein